jgi:hypothetical protein
MAATEIDKDGKESQKRRFDARDWQYVADHVIEEYERRKSDRRDLEKVWKDIDRQIAMEPERAFKYIVKDGSRIIDDRKAWMAETELPLQAQALEVLSSDARRMLFPQTGSWFRAHAAVTDEYLKSVDFTSIILGDEAEVPSLINQDNADKLVEGFLLDMFGESFGGEDFYTRVDRINAESFKYGMGVGRARRYKKTLYMKGRGGVQKDTRCIPVMAPASIKNLYLDNPKPSMHSAQLLEPGHIARDYIKLENLHMAANRGSDDPDDEDGGWMPSNLKKIVADDKGYVTLLEYEGDLVVPRKTTRSMVLAGCIVTVVLGGKDGSSASRGVVRFRWRKSHCSSYLLFPYHYESAGEPYPTSPLMKGRPVQIAATDACNRFLDSAALKIGSPVSYDRSSMAFAQEGGPSIFPYALWPTTDGVKVHSEVGGEPASMAAAMSQLVNLYAELTGVLPARLGAQSVSHTTAFAKDAELQRGAVRTVDYVQSVGQGAMTHWLDMAYKMGRDEISSRDTVVFFIAAYGGYVEVTKDQLPEKAIFEWFGSGGPAEEHQKRMMRVQSLQLALQMDQLGAAYGKPPTVDLGSAVAQVLREGGWTDLDSLIQRQQPGQISPEMMAQIGPGPATAALQQMPGLSDAA